MKPSAFGLFCLALALAGCGSSDPDYYTLKSWPGAAQGGGPASLKLRTPTVSGTLDRDYIVRNDRDYRLRLAGNAAWSEPLGDMIGQTLAQDLQQRLPGTSVFTQAGAVSTDAAATLELDVGQFAEDPDGRAEITATLSIERRDAGSGILPARLHPLHLVRPVEGTGTAALVAALSALLGDVADVAAREARGPGSMPLAAGPAVPPPA